MPYRTTCNTHSSNWVLLCVLIEDSKDCLYGESLQYNSMEGQVKLEGLQLTLAPQFWQLCMFMYQVSKNECA